MTKGNLHIFESLGSKREIIDITILDDRDTPLGLIENPQETQIEEAFELLKKDGVNPEKIYISLWSNLSSLITKVWPHSKVLIDYCD